MKIEISDEAGDAFVVGVLKEHRKILNKELKQWRKNPKTDKNPNGKWMHPDDVVFNEQMVKRLEYVISYFGGEL